MPVLTLKNDAAYYFISSFVKGTIAPLEQRVADLRKTEGDVGAINRQISEETFRIDVLKATIQKLGGQPITREAIFDVFSDSFLTLRAARLSDPHEQKLKEHIEGIRALYCNQEVQGKIMYRAEGQAFEEIVRTMTSDFAAASGLESEGVRAVLTATSFERMFFLLETRFRTCSVLAYGEAHLGGTEIKLGDVEGYRVAPVVF